MILVFWKVHVLEIKSQRFRSTRYSLDGNSNAMVDTSTCGGSILLQRAMESELKRWHNKPFAMWEPFTLLGFGVH
jgi:hypothetical protein